MGNPISNIDPDGRSVESTHYDTDGNFLAYYDDGDNSVYEHEVGTTKNDLDSRHYYSGFQDTSRGGDFLVESMPMVVTSTTSGVLVHGDGNYTIPAGETNLEMTETVWGGGSLGVGLSYGNLSIQTPSNYPDAIRGEVTTGNSMSITGGPLRLPVEVLAATKGRITLDESITGSSLEEMFSGTNFVTTRSVSAAIKYTRVDAYDNQGEQNRIFKANLVGAGVGTVGYSGSRSVVQFKNRN